MFWIKKLIALMTFPLAGLLALLVLGAVLAWRERGGPWPRRCIAAATLGLVVVCCGPAGDLLISPLENRHPPLTSLDEIEAGAYIVVLGGGLHRRKGGPVTSELTDSSAIRLFEGIRLHRALEDSTLIVSGGTTGQHRATADAMAELAIAVGVPPERIERADRALDTAQEASAVAQLASPRAPIIVVTEASHMPRSILLFERAGLAPIAAPTMHRASASPWHPGALWPSASNVRKVERSLYEYIALIWVGLGGS